MELGLLDYHLKSFKEIMAGLLISLFIRFDFTKRINAKYNFLYVIDLPGSFNKTPFLGYLVLI